MSSICRICESRIEAPDFRAPAPAMTSLSTLIAAETEVGVCPGCGHVQSPDLPDVQAFYDREYRISLQSDDHDQLYEQRDGSTVFRTDRQAELVLELDLPEGARILDFGAAKAATLKKVVDARPDLEPHVFDVSRDYCPHWDGWIAADNQATYDLPERWAGRFDVITAHFVLEHIADPVAVFETLRRCLAPKGRLFFTVPDPLANPGDLLVVDHLNHFTEPSLRAALSRAGFGTMDFRAEGFRGAHVVVARPGPGDETDGSPAVAECVTSVRAALAGWGGMLEGIARAEVAGRRVAIYGAGFYGTLIASRLGEKPVCFLDRNPHLQGQTHLGCPVLTPEACPDDIEAIFAGLNPLHARRILPHSESWIPAGARLIYLEG
ncbi:methyltransferase domain-containing protein [Stappia sp.]|uniref:class I SAM-dependent methyltransferase n=1 Tax=Stappia sp. TaxID=1870903 RepID=UPI0032D95CEB